VACCGFCFVARLCVTSIGLGQNNFLCPGVSSLLQFMRTPLHVVVVLLCVVVEVSSVFGVF